MGETVVRTAIGLVLGSLALGCGGKIAGDGGDAGDSTGDATGDTGIADGGSTTGEPVVCEPAVIIAPQDVDDPALGHPLEDDVSPFDVHVGVVNETKVHVAWLVTVDGVAELHVVDVLDGDPGSVGVTSLGSFGVTPAFASDRGGRLYVTWVDDAGTLQLLTRDADGTTGDPVPVSTIGAGASEPTIALDADGGFDGVVAWYQGVYELQTALLDDGVPGSVEAVPASVNRTFGVLAPDVGISAGVVRLSWDDVEINTSFPDSPDIFMVQRDAAGTWSNVINISSSSLPHSSESAVVPGPDGWHLVWVEQNHGADITNFEVWYAFESGGAFTTPLDISREGLSNNVLSPQWPRIRFDCSGSSAFGWFSRPPDRPQNSALFHMVPDATSAFVPVFAAEMNHDAGWAIDGAGVHHFAWVSAATLTGTSGVRYLRVQ